MAILFSIMGNIEGIINVIIDYTTSGKFRAVSMIFSETNHRD